jgi:hypothetical protein
MGGELQWAQLGSNAEIGGRDAAITDTLGSVPLRSGGHPWLPVNAASSRLSQTLALLNRNHAVGDEARPHPNPLPQEREPCIAAS